MHHYAAIMFLAGIGIPILAALNAALGRFILSPIVAAAILFTIAGLVTWALAFATGLNPLKTVNQAPKHLFFAGVLIAFYVLSRARGQPVCTWWISMAPNGVSRSMTQRCGPSPPLSTSLFSSVVVCARSSAPKS